MSAAVSILSPEQAIARRDPAAPDAAERLGLKRGEAIPERTLLALVDEVERLRERDTEAARDREYFAERFGVALRGDDPFRAAIDRIAKQREALVRALRWCAGASAFARGGSLYREWLRRVRPLLKACKGVGGRP